MLILSLLFILPLVAVFFIGIIKYDAQNEAVLALHRKNIHYIASLISILYIILVGYIAYNYNYLTTGFQLVYSLSFSSFNFSYFLGMDSISLIFIITSALMFFFVFTFLPIPVKNPKMYTALLLLILSFSTITFLATDLLLFFIFYELSMLPVLFIIGFMGKDDKVYIFFKFLVYTLLSSTFLLIALVVVLNTVGSTNIEDIRAFDFSQGAKQILFLCFFIAFAIKLAIFPFHGWMADVYESAPIGLNIILSGVLLKYGIYGILRFIVYTIPDIVSEYVIYIYILTLFSMFYTAFMAYQQKSFKRFFAYLSVSHISMIVAAIVTINNQGLEGAIFHSFVHSIYNAGIFYMIFLLAKRFESYVIDDFSGIAKVMPYFSIFFVIILLTTISFPITNSFIGEILILIGIYNYYRVFTIFFAFSMLINAIVMIKLNQKLIFSDVSDYVRSFRDISIKESIPLIIIVGIIVFTGVYPDIILKYLHLNIYSILDNIGIINL